MGDCLMAVIYGWAYAIFNANVGWERGAEPEYDYWENYWSLQVNSYIFPTAGSLLTDADEKAEIQTLINRMMVLMNLYLKGESNETPMQSGFYSNPGFPQFQGNPEDSVNASSGDYIILDKYKREKSQNFVRADSIRVGINPDNIYFSRDNFYY